MSDHPPSSTSLGMLDNSSRSRRFTNTPISTTLDYAGTSKQRLLQLTKQAIPSKPTFKIIRQPLRQVQNSHLQLLSWGKPNARARRPEGMPFAIFVYQIVERQITWFRRSLIEFTRIYQFSTAGLFTSYTIRRSGTISISLSNQGKHARCIWSSRSALKLWKATSPRRGRFNSNIWRLSFGRASVGWSKPRHWPMSRL
jgi:hypothetical protein